MPEGDGHRGEAPLLEVRDLTVAFGGIVAVSDLSFEVRRGEILALLGPNGAGKTTTFHAVAGAVRPTAGTIRLEGGDVTALKPDARCRRGIARTFQITQPFNDLSVTENVMVGASRHHRTIAGARAEAARYVDYVGLAEKADAPARSLSTGQRKRLELARALATRPRLLMMDEVTGGVDQKGLPALVGLVERLKAEGMTILLIEHNMAVISRLADRAVFMNRGKRVAEGTPAEIAGHPEVVELYLGEAAHG